jgi:hypothetical protein
MATTHDFTTYPSFANYAPPWGGGGGNRAGWIGWMPFHVDMAALKTYFSHTVSGAASDVIQMWTIPVGFRILGVHTELITPEGSACTMAIGDGNSTAGYMAAFSLNGVAGTMSGTIAGDAYNLTCGTPYETADTLDLLFATLADIKVAVFDIFVLAAIANRIKTPLW